VPRVAVVGNFSRDVVDGGAPTPGGGPCCAAEAFRRLGGASQIVSRFAERDRDLFQPVLETPGVELTLLPAETTTGFTMSYDGERRSMDVTALGESWRIEEAAALAEDVAWVHVAPLLRDDFPPAVLAALATGRRLSLDGQGLTRRRELGPLVRDAGFDPEVLASVTALKLSEEEARIVAGRRFDAEAAAALGVPEILVTLGSDGVIVFAGDDEAHVPARPVPGVHTTGAGDTFMVGYASARSTGRGPVESAALGCELVTDVLESRRKGRQ